MDMRPGRRWILEGSSDVPSILCSVACLALVPVRDKQGEQMSGGWLGVSGGQRTTCELVFVTLLPGLLLHSHLRVRALLNQTLLCCNISILFIWGRGGGRAA